MLIADGERVVNFEYVDFANADARLLVGSGCPHAYEPEAPCVLACLVPEPSRAEGAGTHHDIPGRSLGGAVCNGAAVQLGQRISG